MANRFFPNYKTYIITSKFGLRTHPVTGQPQKMHNGIDIVATNDGVVGQADKIMAHTGGTVVGVGFDKEAGNFVNIKVSKDTIMAYYHMRDLSTLQVGDEVKTGDIIGIVGKTGTASGKHLHWGIKKNGQWIDPAPYLDSDYTVIEEPVIATGTVLTAQLNVREKPGTQNKVVDVLVKGEKIDIYEKVQAGGATWGRIPQGWTCLSKYVQVVDVKKEPENKEPEKKENKNFTLTMRELSRGDKGEDVRALQNHLKGFGYNIEADNSFGPATENAVKQYQAKNGLTANGIVDAKTRAKMNGLA